MFVSPSTNGNPLLAPNADRFCTQIDLFPPQGQIDVEQGITSNQALAGTANPRTLVKPTIVAPISEISYWRENPLASYSQINTRTVQYPQESGWVGNTELVALQPNVYTYNTVHQPINATNGIAIVPEFPDVTQVIATPDQVLYGDYNIPPQPHVSQFPVYEGYTSMGSPDAIYPWQCPGTTQPSTTSVLDYEPNIYNTYDPRFSGYGSADRSYQSPMLGNTQYFYDDVDALRMPNYITRNKLDSCLTPYGDAYGNINSGNVSLSDVKRLAEQSYLDNSLSFRDDMMKSLMRKRNEEMNQIRSMPKITMRQPMNIR